MFFTVVVSYFRIYHIGREDILQNDIQQVIVWELLPMINKIQFYQAHSFCPSTTNIRQLQGTI